jgi:anti-sigma B factor antagonist
MQRVTVERSAGGAAVVARGALDAYEAPALSDAFAAVAGDARVVVDLAAVSFLDSTALGVVVRAVKEIEQGGGQSRVVLPRGTGRRIFELTTLDQALPVVESREQALTALTQPPASGT